MDHIKQTLEDLRLLMIWTYAMVGLLWLMEYRDIDSLLSVAILHR